MNANLDSRLRQMARALDRDADESEARGHDSAARIDRLKADAFRVVADLIRTDDHAPLTRNATGVIHFQESADEIRWTQREVGPTDDVWDGRTITLHMSAETLKLLVDATVALMEKTTQGPADGLDLGFQQVISLYSDLIAVYLQHTTQGGF